MAVLLLPWIGLIGPTAGRTTDLGPDQTALVNYVTMSMAVVLTDEEGTLAPSFLHSFPRCYLSLVCIH
jgi:hypothetical protein